jgi:hypothetical protein
MFSLTTAVRHVVFYKVAWKKLRKATVVTPRVRVEIESVVSYHGARSWLLLSSLHIIVCLSVCFPDLLLLYGMRLMI